MPGWTLNWGAIREDLLVGSCPTSLADLRRIRDEAGATAVFSLQHPTCHRAMGLDYEELRGQGASLGLVMQNEPMRDFDPPDQAARLPIAVRRLYHLLEAKHRVYVHCTAGVNRSPLAVLGLLTLVEGRSLGEALTLLQRGRPEAAPYLDAYEDCREALVARHEEEISRRLGELEQEAADLPGHRRRTLAEAQVLRDALTRLDAEVPG